MIADYLDPYHWAHGILFEAIAYSYLLEHSSWSVAGPGQLLVDLVLGTVFICVLVARIVNIPWPRKKKPS
jgi:hypothetical protein